MIIKKRKTIQLLLSLSIGLMILVTSCMGVKPQSTKSAKSLTETYYVGEEGTQYFVNPLKFSGPSKDEVMSLDITFRYKDKIVDSATVNFSIFSSSVIKTLDRFSIDNGKLKSKSEEISLLYNEKKKREFVSRFSTKCSMKELYDLFQNEQWVISTSNKNAEFLFNSTKKTNKSIAAIRDNIFILMKEE